jgi:hypothetical protein
MHMLQFEEATFGDIYCFIIQVKGRQHMYKVRKKKEKKTQNWQNIIEKLNQEKVVRIENTHTVKYMSWKDPNFSQNARI